MTDIEAKALALVREVLAERNLSDKRAVRREVSPYTEALCRAIEQHEATKQELADFKQEVSDEAAFFAGDLYRQEGWEGFDRFIIPKPKPDPLVDLLADIDVGAYDSVKAEYADLLRKDLVGRLRAALEARGLEIREKGQCPCTNSCSITSGGIFTTGPTMRFGSDK